MNARTTRPLAASLLSVVFVLAVACGNGSTTGTPGTGGSSAGTTGAAGTSDLAGTTGSGARGGSGGAAGTSGGPGGTTGAGGAGCSCDPRTQFCYVMEGGAIGTLPQYSCRTLPAACGTAPTCACVQGQGCGNICSAGDGGITVICQAP